MSDVKITFSMSGDIIGQMESSLESFDAAPHIIPQNIIDTILLLYVVKNEPVEVSFSVSET